MREGGLLDEPGQPFPVAQTGGLCAEGFEVIAHHLVHHTLRRHPRLIGRRWLGHASGYGASRATSHTRRRRGADWIRLEQPTPRHVLSDRPLTPVRTPATGRSLPHEPQQRHWARGSFCTLAGKRKSQFLPHHGRGSPTRCDRRRPRCCARAADVRTHSSIRNSEEAPFPGRVLPCSAVLLGVVAEPVVGQPETTGGVRLVAAGCRQRMSNQLSLERFHPVPERPLA